MADMRWCIGSVKFGIEVNWAPAIDSPVQPSQMDGSDGCASPTGNQYTSTLRKVALARKAVEAAPGEPEVTEALVPTRPGRKRATKVLVPEPGAQRDAR